MHRKVNSAVGRMERVFSDEKEKRSSEQNIRGTKEEFRSSQFEKDVTLRR